MAGALRKVSQNYNWTIKRADNDLHDVISGAARPQRPLLSFPEVKPVALSVSPWDPNRLRWKFRTDYGELRGHLDSAFLIIVSWLMSINYLLRAGIRHIIWHPISSVVRSYKKSIELASPGTFPMSIRSLLFLLFRLVASLIVSLLWEIYVCSLPIDVKTCPKDKSGVQFPSQLARQPISVQEPIKVSHGLSGDQASALDNTGNATCAATLLQPAAPSADDPKDRAKPMRTVVYDEARRSSHRKNSHYDSPEHRHDARKAPRHRLDTAEVLLIHTLGDDVPAIWMGDGGPLAHDPVSLAL